MEHKVTTEKILQAAQQCPDAQKVLKTLFPDAFGDATFLEFPKSDDRISVPGSGGGVISRRNAGNYVGKGIFLPNVTGRVWAVVTDDLGYQVLVARLNGRC